MVTVELTAVMMETTRGKGSRIKDSKVPQRTKGSTGVVWPERVGCSCREGRYAQMALTLSRRGLDHCAGSSCYQNKTKMSLRPGPLIVHCSCVLVFSIVVLL